MIPEYLTPIANHLWQTTLFVAVAWALAFSLRRNSATIRYGVWMAASIKFLIPFSVLVATGSHFQWRITAQSESPRIATIVENVAEPFFFPDSLPTSAPASQPAPRSLAGPIGTIWLIGFLGTLFFWARWWIGMRRTLRSAAAVVIPGVPIPGFSCQHRIEPGVFGIWRPALLLPEGVLDRLTAEQLQTIIAHEMAHVQRRDNLSMTMHMLVEAIFWVHPFVWLIRHRLVQREKACDEIVLGAGAAPRVYAEAILGTCKVYLASPSVSMSGVTGSNLKSRIEAIVANTCVARLSRRQIFSIASVAALSFLGPMFVGSMRAGSPPRLERQDKLEFDAASLKPADENSPLRGGRCTGIDSNFGGAVLPQAPPALGTCRSQKATLTT